MLSGENRQGQHNSCWESNSGHLWLELPMLDLPLSHDSLPTLTILYMYCTGSIECLSCTPGSHSVCAVRIPLGVDQKFLSIKREPMLSDLLTLNAQNIMLHTRNKEI